MDAGQLIDSPPEPWVVGLIDDVAEQLNTLREAGVSRVMCQHLAHEDTDFVELLGTELAPLLAG